MSRVTQNQSSLYWLTSWPLASNPFSFSLSLSLFSNCFRHGTFRMWNSHCECVPCVHTIICLKILCINRKISNVKSAAIEKMLWKLCVVIDSCVWCNCIREYYVRVLRRMSFDQLAKVSGNRLRDTVDMFCKNSIASFWRCVAIQFAI